MKTQKYEKSRKICKTFSIEDYVTVCTKKLNAESKIYFLPSPPIKLSNQIYHPLNYSSPAHPHPLTPSP